MNKLPDGITVTNDSPVITIGKVYETSVAGIEGEWKVSGVSGSKVVLRKDGKSITVEQTSLAKYFTMKTTRSTDKSSLTLAFQYFIAGKSVIGASALAGIEDYELSALLRDKGLVKTKVGQSTNRGRFVGFEFTLPSDEYLKEERKRDKGLDTLVEERRVLNRKPSWITEEARLTAIESINAAIEKTVGMPDEKTMAEARALADKYLDN